MSFFTFAVLAAVLATIVALVSGITSMARNGEVGHLSSGQWMVRRVLFQGIALVLVLVAIYLAS